MNESNLFFCPVCNGSKFFLEKKENGKVGLICCECYEKELLRKNKSGGMSE